MIIKTLLRIVFLFIFLQLSTLCSNVLAQDWNIDAITLNNLSKNNAIEEEYKLAEKILKDKKVTIGETQEYINFINNTLQKMFDTDGPICSSKFPVLNELLKLGRYNEPEVKELLVSKYDYGFSDIVLEANPNIILEDVNRFIETHYMNTNITDKALSLIIKGNHLVDVYDILYDIEAYKTYDMNMRMRYGANYKGRQIYKISELNEYAQKRYEYDPTNSISDTTLRTFLLYAQRGEEQLLMVDKALKEQNIEAYNSILQELKNEKLKKQEAERLAKIQQVKDERKAKKELRIKCLKSTEAHIDNMYAFEKRDNVAFWLGMLNPINTIATIANLPFYTLFSMYYHALEGLH